MQKTISDYGIIGDCRSIALVHRTGAIEWMGWPTFSSPSWFASLLGNETDGHWTIAPKEAARITREYRDNTLILETKFETQLLTHLSLVHTALNLSGKGPVHYRSGGRVST